MRDVSKWASRVAPLLAVFLLLGVASAWAAEPPLPTDPPQARAQPPVGLTAQARMNPPVGVTWTDMALIWLSVAKSIGA
jgi:hypothetical protein